jgi:glycerophosphoryl diester phosphodiesterase
MAMVAGVVIGGIVAVYSILFVVARVRLEERRPIAFSATSVAAGSGAVANRAAAPDGASGSDREIDGSPFLVVAHQGGELLRPSNTLIAFQRAADLGADVLDTDLHRTADGELVLIHDETVDRTSDGSGAVWDLTLDELRELDFGYRFTTDDGATFPYRGEGHGIVTLDELFTTFDDGIRFGIEIKQTEPEAATELCDSIRRHAYQDRVLVSSFGRDNMDVFRSACPEVPTSATESEVRTFYLLHRAGLNGLVAPDYEALQIPESSGRFHLLTGGLIDAAHAWGLLVIPWTIDDPDDLARIADLGVDGINTNRPDLLADLVDRID